MHSTFSYLTALFIFALILSCNRKIVSLNYTNASGEVQQLNNLVFRFDKPLVPDSLVNEWDSTRYISFEPRIAGRFRWEHPDELIFSPSRPLPPATTFTATLSSELLQFSKYDGVEKTDKIRFSTPALKLENTYITWVVSGEKTTTAVPQVDLHFNYPVNPKSIREKLKVLVDGNNMDFTMSTLSKDNKISLRVNNLKPTDKDLQAFVQLAKGMVPEGGTNGTPELIDRKVLIPSPYNLSINDFTSEHNGVSGTIMVHTSQQVILDDLRAHISLTPAIKYSVEETEDGFAIRSSNFDVSKSYLVTLRKGLRGRIGGTLKEEYDSNVAFGELEPAISFSNNKSVFLSGKGSRQVEVSITNIEKVKVLISKIYESNILAAHRYGYAPADSRNSEDENEDYYEEPTGDLALGEVIFEKEIDTRSLPKNGNSRIFKFDPEDRLPEFKGIYHIKIRSTKNYWLSDSRFISLSDIGLIAREARDRVIVIASSISTAAQLDGVQVAVYGSNNQVLGLGTTNNEGVADVALIRKQFAGFRPAMIVAKTANDFNYLPFNTTRVNTSRFEVGGKRSNITGLDAFIYAERDIYRPGERVNFSVILRDRFWKSPGELPVKMKFLLPNGKELKNFRKTLNEQGSIEGQAEIPPAAITGIYTLEVYTSNDVLLGSKNFNVEEFVPDRIKVNAVLDQRILYPGQTGHLSITALNFFGPPAANRNFETEIQIKPLPFSPKKFERYNFSIQNPEVTFDKVVSEGKTDISGKANADYIVPDNFKNIGILQASFYATVFDETGRPVSRNATAEILTQQHFFGIASDGYNYYALNQAVRFPVIAVDRSGNVLNGVVTNVKVIKHEYRTHLIRNGNFFRYESQQDDKLVSDQSITITGENYAYSYIPRTPGEYEIRISIPGASGFVSNSFYSYGSWGSSRASFEVNTEGNIDIETDRTTYKPGENAKVLFKTPFSGRMLVTMETDKVLTTRFVNVEERSASIDLPVLNDHLPNVYITATLFKPHETSEIPLTVAHGYKSLRVEEASRHIPVQLIADKNSRSRTHKRVVVKALPNSFITLAAVDNGVLQVTDFKTPDPYRYFYADRALEVIGYDLYPLLFPEIRKTFSSTGGDGGEDMAKRVNPMPAKRIQILSFWSGIKKASDKGEAIFEFDIPQFSGEVRLMAVAYRDQSFGAAEAAMTIADPIVLSSALPRFLSPKDSISVPVTITNTTGRPASVIATIRVSGALKTAGKLKQEFMIEANSEKRALFQVNALNEVNTGRITVEVQAFGEKFIEETEISVRPASPLQFTTGSGSIVSSNTQRLSIPIAGFMNGTTDYRLVVGRNPVLEIGEQMRYLVQYPYGCTEQTVSVAFPQLYYNDLAELMQHRYQAGNANVNIQEAIRKIKMRQLYNGAVTMWDGEGSEDWWVTAYAAHFLLEARKAGFDVDKSLLETMLVYLNTKLRNRETILYFYNRNQQKKIAPKEVAYSLYVLALAGRPNISTMNFYKASPALLSLDSKYLLSVSYAVAGDKTRFREILPSSFTGEESVAQTGGSLYSDIRDEAISLNALIDVDPGNPQVPVMAKHVAEKLKARRWYNTQESSFSFLALGKIARAANKSTITGEIRVKGKLIAKATDKVVKLDARQLGGNEIEIVTSGEGRLYYYWQAEGINAAGEYKEEDNYIKVRRKFFDRYGRMLTGYQMKQNELIVVQVSLEKLFSGRVDNIVITDILPAGFEIENPRTKEIPGMEWIKDASTPTALDVRDDRINFFVDLINNRQTYYYAVRAVSPGVFRMGPVSADAMYNGEYHSYHGAGKVVVNN